jgi:hypothetical protein
VLKDYKILKNKVFMAYCAFIAFMLTKKNKFVIILVYS